MLKMLQSFLNELSSLFPAFPLKAVNHDLAENAQKYLDSLTKPQGSLGRLEEIASRLYVINAGKIPLSVDPTLMLVVAADHGVAVQGVSPFPQVVTRQMVLNFLNGGAAINALCFTFNIDLKIVDAGCSGPPFQAHPLLLERRIANSTRDLSQEQAMSKQQCISALLLGFKLGLDFARDYACLCTGEMGIANSTSATALYCAFLALSPHLIAGPGAGAKKDMLEHKKQIVVKALNTHQPIIENGDPVAILAALGGFEIAMLAGIMLSCASTSRPFLVDGFICTSAYLAASKIFPPLSGYAFFAHSSAEPAYDLLLSSFPEKPKPLLDMAMRLGEGTGAALAVPILRGACAIYNNMATMAKARVSAEEEDRLD